MIVTPIPGRKGDPIARHDDILCLFDRRARQPRIGEPIEVMISHAPTRRFPDGYFDMSEEQREKNPPRISFLIVRPVTEDDCLVDHAGFECSGSMCRTMARVSDASCREMRQRFGQSTTWLTPGRSPVIEVSNVNVRYPDKSRPLIPGQAYVAGADLHQGLVRITGLPSLDQVDPATMAELVRQQPRLPAPPRPRRAADTLTSRRGMRTA